jgi:hypothetical protein
MVPDGQLSLELFPEVDVAAGSPQPEPRASESARVQVPPEVVVPDVTGCVPDGAALLTTREAAQLLHVDARTVQCPVERSEMSAVHLGPPEARHAEVKRDSSAALTGATEKCAVLPSTRGEASVAATAHSHAAATALLDAPDALLTRTHLRELGLERRAVDAVFRALAVVALPGYSRPMIRVRDYLELIENYTFRDDRVRPSGRVA